MKVSTFDPETREWDTPTNDGRILFETGGGRTFTIRETEGAFTLESGDGEMLIHPISRSKIEIDTPLT